MTPFRGGYCKVHDELYTGRCRSCQAQRKGDIVVVLVLLAAFLFVAASVVLPAIALLEHRP